MGQCRARYGSGGYAGRCWVQWERVGRCRVDQGGVGASGVSLVGYDQGHYGRDWCRILELKYI